MENMSADRQVSASASASYCCRKGLVELLYLGLRAPVLLRVTASPADVPGIALPEALPRGESRGEARGEPRGDSARGGDNG